MSDRQEAAPDMWPERSVAQDLIRFSALINGGKHATLAEALGDARPGDFVTITGEVPTASIEAYLLKPPRCKKCDAPFIEVPTGQRTSTTEGAGHGISRVTHIIETTYAPGCDCA